jgi:16S rRNA (guanine966-N2)-methyltransferase
MAAARNNRRRAGSPADSAATVTGGKPGGRGTVRIIGGSWRGRRLPVRDSPGLRPSTDRVRETVFNWLQGRTVGARCLDLFAGSGALGLEALSRGAAQCTFVDTERANLRHIEGLLQRLDAEARAECRATTAAAFLQGGPAVYDLIFIDPPFASGLLAQTATLLEQSGACGEQTLIYVEQDATDRSLTLPAHWQVLRDKRAGNVRYGLYSIPTPPVGE